jgi:RNA polymerase sigma-70 factor (ECF subfamily)
MTPLDQEIVEQLPSLRRYACALTGNRQIGDEYVHAALAALADEPWRIGASDDVKPQLFRLFHHVMDALHVRISEASNDADDADPYQDIKRGLLDLPLLTRKLLLLVTVERFPLERAASVLGLPAREAKRRFARARIELSGLARSSHDVRSVPPRQSGAA